MIDDPRAWMLDAQCRDQDPNLWHPVDHVGVGVAVAACAGCPVTVECLDYALREGMTEGVWGGRSERERRRMRRQMGLTSKSAGLDWLLFPEEGQ